MTALSIQERRAEDIAAAVELLRTVHPARVITEAGSRHRLLGAPPEGHTNWWAAWDGDTLVAWATAGVNYESSARSGYVGVSVLPSHRRRGVGTTLLERALEHLEDAPRILGSVDADGRAFAERHGFRQTHTRRISGIDPGAVDTSELESSGVEVVSLREIGPAQTFAVDAESVLDEPGADPIDMVDYEQWLHDYWERPDLDFDVGRAALVDGKPVAVAYVMVDHASHRALSAYAGTLRAYRGRGLARLAKLGVMRRLAELGVTLALTENDATNAPMLAINERLGYQPVETRYTYVLDR